jgi:hypothetical protein
MSLVLVVINGLRPFVKQPPGRSHPLLTTCLCLPAAVLPLPAAMSLVLVVMYGLRPFVKQPSSHSHPLLTS